MPIGKREPAGSEPRGREPARRRAAMAEHDRHRRKQEDERADPVSRELLRQLGQIEHPMSAVRQLRYAP